MLTITDGGSLTRALSSSIDPQLKRLLVERRNQLGGDIEGLARFLIPQPGDTLEALENELGFSIFQNAGDGTWFGDPEFTPGWDWIEDSSFAWELVFEFTTDFTHIVLIENSARMHPELLRLCNVQA